MKGVKLEECSDKKPGKEREDCEAKNVEKLVEILVNCVGKSGGDKRECERRNEAKLKLEDCGGKVGKEREDCEKRNEMKSKALEKNKCGSGWWVWE